MEGGVGEYFREAAVAAVGGLKGGREGRGIGGIGGVGYGEGAVGGEVVEGDRRGDHRG